MVLRQDDCSWEAENNETHIIGLIQESTIEHSGVLEIINIWIRTRSKYQLLKVGTNWMTLFYKLQYYLILNYETVNAIYK